MDDTLIDNLTDKIRMINRKTAEHVSTPNRCIYGCVCVNDCDSS